MNINRRYFLSSSAAASVAAFFGISGHAAVSPVELDKLIEGFGNGAVGADEGPLQLIIPDVAEDGFRVPLSFTVDSPMTEDDHVESVMIIARDNPNAEVATFHFKPASGLASASTQIRLARTQEVVALARTSSGELYKASKQIKVVIGGCGSDTDSTSSSR